VATFVQFSSNRARFQSLHRADQEILLRHNAPLFLQYILAKFIGSPDPVDQLAWILNGCVQLFYSDDRILFQRIRPTQLSLDFGLASSFLTSDVYVDNSVRVTNLFPASRRMTGLVANFLLFRTTDAMRQTVNDVASVDDAFAEAVELFRLCRREMEPGSSGHNNVVGDVGVGDDFYATLRHLDQMKCIFEMWTIEQSSGSCAPRMLVFDYTEAEETWLQHQLTLVQEQFVSVTPSEAFVKEGLAITRGKSADSSFVSGWVMMTGERARRALKVHPEFLGLVGSDQVCPFENSLPFVRQASLSP